MSDDQSQSSTSQADDIAAEAVIQPIENDAPPKKKNILVRIYQNPRSKILLAVFALLMVGVGFVATQKVQNSRSEAAGPNPQACNSFCIIAGACHISGTLSIAIGYTYEDYENHGCPSTQCYRDCRVRQNATGFTSQQQRIAYTNFLNSIGGSDTPENRARFLGSGSSAAAAQAAEEARIRAEWQRAYAYATELKKQQEYRDAAAYARACQAAQSIKPTLTWLSTQGGRSTILPGEKKIKFQTGANQDGAIIFIDDKANPWSGSCNNLKTGDKCLVPDGKGVNKHADGTTITKAQVGAAGKTQTTYSGFEDGHSYRVWLKGASCGKLSPDSNKLDITVAANDLSGTPTASPSGTNTQQQGHL